jgi:mono/diheme cytochrome c family protein
MKKIKLVGIIIICCISYISFITDENKPVPIPATPQQIGNASVGYKYLITGDYLKSGIPYNLFLLAFGKDKSNYLQRDSFNKQIPHDFTAIKAPNGERVVSPNCLQCHAQVFENQLYVGLGNTFIDFSIDKPIPKFASVFFNALETLDKKKYAASKNFIQAAKALQGNLTTTVRGVNAADHLAGVLAAHRNPEDFKWSDTPLIKIAKNVVPTDVPAWWLLKKKNAMFYNGFGRGDFGRFLMASNLLTVTDTSEAREVYTHFNDVLAFINSIEPPKYPKNINEELAALGEVLFNNNCSKCHGTYGSNEKYPNLLIPASIIRTDSALYISNYSSPEVIDWFNKSWFTKGDNAAQLVPYLGYIAPPLDGIWITAPYLHNGSVPTLEAVINSKLRPAYWSRNFDKPEYDYENMGWKYEKHDDGNRKNVYNTTIQGYGNYGHYFGDKLNDEERKAVVEYLKTL